MRGAILRVQLRKLDAIIGAMRWSKYRIRHALEKLPGVRLRNIIDPEGDTGSFLIATYASAQIAKQVNLALRAEGIFTYPDGISNIVMTDWGLHFYYNNLSLADRTSVDSNGFPWKLAENAGLERTYGKGTCPRPRQVQRSRDPHSLTGPEMGGPSTTPGTRIMIGTENGGRSHWALHWSVWNVIKPERNPLTGFLTAGNWVLRFERKQNPRIDVRL